MATFDFIVSSDFRALLEKDAEELVRCMKAGAWKSAHILAASLIQATLVDYLASAGTGRALAVAFRREGQERMARLTTERTPDDLGLEILRRELGVVVRDTRNGPMVSAVTRNSPADGKGIDRGDLLLAVNNRKVKTVEELAKAVEGGFSRSSLVLSVFREPYLYSVTFGLE